MFKYSTQKKRLYYEKVIHLYRDEHLGCRQISRILPLAESSVSEWIRNFVAESPSYISPKMKKEPKRALSESETSKVSNSSEADMSNADVEQLREELAAMRKKLSDAELKAEIYNEMINVAESKFNISIRKKAGTK